MAKGRGRNQSGRKKSEQVTWDCNNGKKLLESLRLQSGHDFI